jgi:hypothetical protein
MFAQTKVAATLAAMALVVALPAAAATTIAGTAAAPQTISQPPRQPAQTPRPTGTATITVTVVAGDEGTPVKGARVALMAVSGSAQSAGPAGPPGQAPVVPAARDGGRPGRLQKQARTGPGGAAAFTELPAGDYMLYVEPPTGFVGGDPASRVQVRSGSQATATVKLNRAGVVTGRVLDEDGDPVTGAMVSVYRLSRGGRAQPGSFATQPTNDLGAYRVWSLPAGDYVVSTRFEDRTQQDESGIVDGYVPTYYPGVAAYDAARAVQVRAGQESGGVDIQLVRGRLGAVSGRVMDSAGNYTGPNGPNSSVSLVSRSRNPGYSGRGAGMRQDGTFLISNVPAGDYYLSATLSRGGGPTAPREGAYVPVTVNGDEVAVTIQTNLGATVSGRVVVEGTPPAQGGTPGSADRPGPTRVMVRSAGGGVYASAFAADTSSGAVRADGTFTLTGIRGPVQIMASGARVALKAVMRGASEISGQPLELLGTERINDIVVVMTYDTGSLQGTVVGESDESLSGAAVLVVPDDPDKWHVGSPFVRRAAVTSAGPGGAGPAAATPGMTPTAQPAGDGSAAFRLTQLPPGRYVVVGFADGADVGTPDPESIQRWRERGTVVSVEAGQTAVVKARAIK